MTTSTTHIDWDADEKELYEQLVATFGEDNVWDTEALKENFVVTSFLAPYCYVVRKSDNVRGSVRFNHSPRFYFDFQASGAQW